MRLGVRVDMLWENRPQHVMARLCSLLSVGYDSSVHRSQHGHRTVYAMHQVPGLHWFWKKLQHLSAGVGSGRWREFRRDCDSGRPGSTRVWMWRW
mmetsp:Transcript_81560/g.221260  ORF Transcript_81560/g.221260 Transcript_81560/m.221260 type:complete len:95 (+) Transcript_81560:70-354(+)